MVGDILLPGAAVRFECSDCRAAVTLSGRSQAGQPLLLHQQPRVEVIVLLRRAAQPLLEVEPGQGVLLVLPVVGGVPVAVLYEVLRGDSPVHGLGGVQQSHDVTARNSLCGLYDL